MYFATLAEKFTSRLRGTPRIESCYCNLSSRQIPCDTDYTPPDNCLQYFTGISGTIQSFNYNAAAGPHLADQDQRVCIRPERGYCTIDYASAAIAGVFGVSGAIAATAIASKYMYSLRT